MNKLGMQAIITGLMCCLLVACGPVGERDKKEYKLLGVSVLRLAKKPDNTTIQIAKPIAAAAYQRSDMLYSKQPYLLTPFANNAWVAEPDAMLAPLLLQSVQNTQAFHAVVGAYYTGQVHWRLETELLEFQQSFIHLPSHFFMVVKANLVNVKADKVVGSSQFVAKVKAPSDTPYGGVIAANQAVKQLLTKMMRFIVKQTRA